MEHGPTCVLPPNFDDEWIRIHYSVKSKNKDAFKPLYFRKTYISGVSKGLYPTYDILHCIFRETINPKVGNLDEIMGYLKDLLIAVHENRGKGKKLDVMDYLWNEMWGVIVLKRNACYGPIIMKIILSAWKKEFPEVELSDPDSWVLHKDKRLRIKVHTEPPVPPKQGRRGKAKDKVVVDEDEGGPSRPPSKGAFGWMAVERRQWKAHYDHVTALSLY